MFKDSFFNNFFSEKNINKFGRIIQSRAIQPPYVFKAECYAFLSTKLDAIKTGA